MTNDLERRFEKKMYELYETAKKEYGYNATRFLQRLRSQGGVAAAHMVLRRRGTKDKPPQGLIEMVDRGGLDITVEVTVLQPIWRRLFSPDELQTARERLARYGYPPARRRRRKTPLTVDEVPNNPHFPEGSMRAVTVNSYERSPGARRECIKHHGALCYVCGFNFGKRYGAHAAGFIHVHHLSALADVGEKYEVNPITDMRPVCPNCHAVIHMQDPPHSIAKVQTMLKKSGG